MTPSGAIGAPPAVGSSASRFAGLPNGRLSVLGWLALPLLAGLAYAFALDNVFVYDDLAAITQNSLIRRIGLGSVFLRGGVSSSGFANGQFRPLTVFTFALNYLVGADHAFGYRLVNLALHTINGILAAWVLRQLLIRVPLSARSPALSQAGATAVALIAAAIFVVHPINSLSILLVWKRATLLATMFSLLAVCCLLALRDGQPRGVRRVFLHAGLVASQVLALGSKENAAILPGLVVLVDLWLLTDLPRRERWRAVLRLQWPVLLVGLAGAVFLLTRDPQKFPMGRFTYLATETKVLWRYLAMAMVPTSVSTVYDVVPAGLDDGYAWLASVGLVAAVGLALAVRRRAPLLAFTVCWAALALGPTSSLVPIPLLMDEDRVYLAFLPLWAFPAYATVWLAARRGMMLRRLVQAGAAAVFLGLLGLTLARVSLWSDPEILWSQASERHPGSFIAATNFCSALLGQPGKARQALAVCHNGYQRFPEQPLLQASLVRAYIAVGEVAKADALLTGFLTQGEPSVGLLTTAGHLAWSRNRPAEAIEHYRRALAMMPLDIEVAIYLARSYAELGLLDPARSLAQQIDRWTPPTDPTLRLALAALHGAVGWTARACDEYRLLEAFVAALPVGNSDRSSLDATCGTSRGGGP